MIPHFGVKVKIFIPSIHIERGDNLRDYEKFRAATVAALSERKRDNGRRWRYVELAKATGYSVNTIEQFMGGVKVTDNVAIAIANALDIPEHLAT